MTWFLFALFLPFSAVAGDITELQWAICETNPATVLAELEKDNWESEQSSITYFETKLPSYYEKGISFRVKEKNGEAVAIVKVRGNDAEPGSERCEFDRYGKIETYACKYEARRVREASPWTEAQKRFAEKFQPVDWASLVPFGPYPVEKWQGKLKKERMSLEALEVPGMSPILELSARVDSSLSEEVYRKITDRLERDGVRLCRKQEGKTDRLFRAFGLRRGEE